MAPSASTLHARRRCSLAFPEPSPNGQHLRPSTVDSHLSSNAECWALIRLISTPTDTNRGPSIVGGWIRLGGRKLAGGSSREEVVRALGTLRSGVGADVFTVRYVYAETARAGTRYAK